MLLLESLPAVPRPRDGNKINIQDANNLCLVAGYVTGGVPGGGV